MFINEYVHTWQKFHFIYMSSILALLRDSKQSSQVQTCTFQGHFSSVRGKFTISGCKQETTASRRGQSCSKVRPFFFYNLRDDRVISGKRTLLQNLVCLFVLLLSNPHLSKVTQSTKTAAAKILSRCKKSRNL